MSDIDEPEYRAYHQPDPADVTLREDDDEGGTFSLRMPIASTGEVRNEGDDPLERAELDGMAAQINEGDVGVFLAHGHSFEISDARYGQTERLGSWQDAEVDGGRDDGTDMLVATAVMADPDTLPDTTGRFREALSILKEQAKRDIPLSSSIGWREDDAAPGGNDLMEASIVGIPADPRTNSQDAAVAVLARSALAAGADPEAFVETVRAAVMGSDADADEHMTDTDTEPDEEHDSEAGTDEEQAEREDGLEEKIDRMLELQRETNRTLGTVAEVLRDDNDDDDEEENESDDDEEEDEDEENAADEPDGDQDTDEVAEQREALETLREGGYDVSDLDVPEPDEEQDADGEDETDEQERQRDDTGDDEADPGDRLLDRLTTED